MMSKKSKIGNNALQLRNIEIERRKIKAVSYLFPLVTFVLFYFSFRHVLQNSLVPVAAQMIWALGLGILFPARGAMGSAIDSLLEEKNSRIERIRVVYKAFNITSTSLLALLVFPLIYYSPLPQKILLAIELAKTLSNVAVDYLLKAVTVFLSGLSGFIGNIILGVLGNLIYDIGKNIYQRNRNRRSKFNNK